jgi:type I restriction enzyme M protein
MNTSVFQVAIKSRATRAIGQANINAQSLKQAEIPLPPIPVQEDIIAHAEEEHKHIQSVKMMRNLFDQKIKSKIAEVWGE